MIPTNLYPRLISFAGLQAAARRAQRGKRYRPAVLAFNANLEAELLRLQEELRSFTYSPGPYRRYPIRYPKPRLISAAPFRDRVVHHVKEEPLPSNGSVADHQPCRSVHPG
jgi:RNA-directed DNA polymerase